MLKLEDIPEDQIMFYDLETTSVFASYCTLMMTGVQYGLKGKPRLVEDWGARKKFRERLASPDMIKVAFNNCNFDDLVLWRHGYPVNEENRHDVHLMAKTVGPRFPAYGLKFLCWYHFGDMHLPEMRLNEWLKHAGLDMGSMYQAPKELLKPYCLYDVTQTINLFRKYWPIVQRPLHWSAYTELELPMGIVMEEIMLRGGEYLDEKLIDEKIATLQNDKLGWEDYVWNLTGGKISNPNSTQQVATYLQDEEKIEFELTEAGNFSLKKEDVLDFLDIDNPNQDRSKIIRSLYEVRKINNTLSYYRNYKEALADMVDPSRPKGWIPKQYSLSRARTRRILSNSRYKINFQNPNHAAKEVQIVPPGWLGWAIDATQIENVVHIFESKDTERRADYEANEDWNEYVWLCNKILNADATKEELDDISKYQFPSNPSWSVYKGYKTIKLAINFGMGVAKYCKMRKLPEMAGKREFGRVLMACPAIKRLQRMVADKLQVTGYVQDVFGHIYSGNVRMAYKVMAYLIQGCGTGSLPKAQMRCNYDTIHQWDRRALSREKGDVVVDKQRGIAAYGVMAGTTHDENSGRLSLALGEEKIVATLQQLMYNMTDRFSHKFDNIPLRAKLYLVRGPGFVNDREEVDVRKVRQLRKIING